MKLLSTLGVVAGGFLMLPKALVALAAIWAIGKVSPVIGVALFAVFLVFGGAR